MPDVNWEDYRINGDLQAYTRRADRLEQASNTVIPTDVLARATVFSSAVPTASKGLVMGAASLGLSTDEFRTLAAQDEERNNELRDQDPSVLGAAMDFGWDAFKAPIRLGFTALGGIAHEVQRPIAAGLDVAAGRNTFAEGYNRRGNSAFVESLQSVGSGQGFQLGEGFFAGGESQAEAERQSTLLINGERAHLGNTIAANTLGHLGFDSDSIAYNTLSFTTQISADILMDPSVVALGGAGTVGRKAAERAGIQGLGKVALEEGLGGLNRARRGIITAGESRDIRTAVELAGGVQGKSRDEILQIIQDNFGMAESRGRKITLSGRVENIMNQDEVFDFMAKNNGYDLARRTRTGQFDKLKSSDNTDAMFFSRLHHAKTKDEAAQIVAEGIGMGSVTDPRMIKGVNSSRFAKTAYSIWDNAMTSEGTAARFSRFLQANPVGALHRSNLLGAALKLDGLERQTFTDVMHIAGKPSTRAERFQQVIDLANPNTPLTMSDEMKAVFKEKGFDVDAMMTAATNSRRIAAHKGRLRVGGTPALPGGPDAPPALNAFNPTPRPQADVLGTQRNAFPSEIDEISQGLQPSTTPALNAGDGVNISGSTDLVPNPPPGSGTIEPFPGPSMGGIQRDANGNIIQGGTRPGPWAGPEDPSRAWVIHKRRIDGKDKPFFGDPNRPIEESTELLALPSPKRNPDAIPLGTGPQAAESSLVATGQAADNVVDDAVTLEDLFGMDEEAAELFANTFVDMSIDQQFRNIVVERLTRLTASAAYDVDPGKMDAFVEALQKIDFLRTTGATQDELNAARNEIFKEFGVQETVFNVNDPGKFIKQIFDANDEENSIRFYAGSDIDGAVSRGPTAEQWPVQNADGSVTMLVKPTPQLMSQLKEGGIFLDEDVVRSVRRAMDRNEFLKHVYDSQTFHHSTAILRGFTRGVFKPLALLRPAFFTRELIDANTRMLAYNKPVSTFWSDPIEYMALMYRSSMRRGTRDLRDINGENFENIARESEALVRDSAHFLDDATKRDMAVGEQAVSRKPNVIRQGAKLVFQGGRKKFKDTHARFWSFRLQNYAKDDAIRAFAGSNFSVDEFMVWADTPAGRRYFEKMAKERPEFWQTVHPAHRGEAIKGWALRRKAELIGGEIDGIKYSGILGGADNEALIDVMRTGQLRNAKGDVYDVVDGGPKDWDGIASTLTDEYAEVAPPTLYAPKYLKTSASAKADKTQRWQRFVNNASSYFISRPSNYFIRKPALRQLLVQNMTEGVASIQSPAARASMVKRMKSEFNLTKREAKKLDELMAGKGKPKNGYVFKEDRFGPGATDDDVEEMWEMIFDGGKAVTLEDASNIFFNISERSAIQQNFDIISPFFDAYVEGIQAYSKLFAENPAFFAKANAGYRSLQVQGQIYTNDNGQDVFVAPGANAAVQAAVRAVIGNTGEFTARPEILTKSMNVSIQSVFPGVGPAVQFASGALLPYNERTKVIHDFVNPFGSSFTSPQDLFDPRKVVNATTPAWFNKIINASTNGVFNQAQYDAMTLQVTKAVAEGSGLDPLNAEDAAEIARRVHRGSTFLLFTRGAFQAVSPGSPNIVWGVNSDDLPTEADFPDGELLSWDPDKDPSGAFYTFRAIADDYRTMRELYEDEADARFIEKYGYEPYYLTQGRSRAQGGVLAENVYQNSWAKQNQKAAENYKDVLGWFAPEGSEDDFDFRIYNEQFEKGERLRLTTEQQITLANHARARQMKSAMRQKLEDQGLNKTEIAYGMRDFNRALQEQYPNWNVGFLTTPGALATPQKRQLTIEQLERAAQSGIIKDSPLTDPLREYFAARSFALEQISPEERDPDINSFRPTKDRAKMAVLRRHGNQLAMQSPEFYQVWNSVLKRELETDDG